jgi:hypothetical protein
MNYELNQYTKQSCLTPNTTDGRINLFKRCMAMLDASIMLSDNERSLSIINMVKNHINVETDTTNSRIAVQLYRILDFIEQQLQESDTDIDKLRSLVQLLGSL